MYHPKSSYVRFWWWFSIGVVFLCAGQVVSTCDPANFNSRGSDINGMDFFTKSHTLEADIEVNMNYENITVRLQEFIDFDTNKMVFKENRMGSSNTLIIRPDKKKEYIIIDESYCTVENNVTYDWSKVVEDLPGHADASLPTFRKSPLRYLGVATKRGIPVDGWQACILDDKTSTYYTVDYFFMRPGWVGKYYKNEPIPISAVVNGLIKKHQHLVPYEDSYEYFTFKTNIDQDQQIYEVPSSMLCAGEINPLQQICDPENYPANGSHVDPDFFKKIQTLETNIEINLRNENLTISVAEYLDVLNDRAAVKMIRKTSTNSFIYRFDKNKVFIIIDENQCVTMNVTKGWNHVAENIPVNSDSTFYTFMKSPQRYIGEDVKRGIPVERWQACLYAPEKKSIYTVDYYFIRPGWYWGQKRTVMAPISAEVNGIVMKHGKPQHFQETYEYLSFKTNPKQNDMIYEVPPDVICEGETHVPVPQLHNKYSYREEIIDAQSKTVSYGDVWYDNDAKLLRTDSRGTGSDSNLITTIHDLNVGVSYKIDRTTGKCKIDTLPATHFDLVESQSPVVNDTAKLYRMKSPLALFYLDNTTYAYRGKDIVRGVKVDVFTGHRNDFSLLGSLFNAKFEVFFLDTEWTEFQNTGVDKTKAIPVQLRLTIDGIADSEPLKEDVYNFYDFNYDLQLNEEFLGLFDIVPCFPSQGQHVELTFEGELNENLLNNKTGFLLATLERLTSVGISPLRIQNLQFDYWKRENKLDRIYVTAILLPKTPTHAQFKKDMKLNGHVGQDDILEHVNSSDACADICVDSGYCQSYDFCPNEKTCYMSKRHDGQQSEELHDSCISGWRPVHVNDGLFPEMELSEAMNEIVLSVNSDDGFVVTVESMADREFRATSVKYNINRDTELSNQGKGVMSKFEQHAGSIFWTTGKSKTEVISSSEKCAAVCIMEDSFNCQTITYCSSRATCILSEGRPDFSSSDNIQKNTACDMFMRRQDAVKQTDSFSIEFLIGIAVGTSVVGFLLGVLVVVLVFRMKRASKSSTIGVMSFVNRNYTESLSEY
ncbi:uncharacterized protein LOC141898534 [Tubulanus polymorphus]|uniref:uncharacterized protein LOC141898534 n=1 Tax=Tubulanus polymorphus TaxID=672921 RepID=UPI003DA2D63F